MRTTRPRPHAGSRAGVTLLEITLGLTLFAIVSSAAVVAGRSGVGAFENTTRTADLEARLRRAVDRVALELVVSIQDELDPDPESDFGTSDLLFRPAVDLNGTEPVPGDFQRIALEMDSAELDDGIDNDGDGLVDEGQLVLIRDDGGADEVRVVLANGVAEMYEGEEANGVDDNGNGVIDEAGFNLQREDDVLVVRLCLQKSSAGDITTRSLETSVRLRN